MVGEKPKKLKKSSKSIEDSGVKKTKKVKKPESVSVVDDSVVQQTLKKLKKRSAKADVANSTVEESSDVSNSVPVPADSGNSTSGKPVTFASLGVCEELCAACEDLGWKAPTKIQQESVPHAIKGHDMIGLAETGSGKTGAFALPILQDLLDNPRGLFALVLAPTRELAFQISEQFEALGAAIGVKCVTLVGGIDMMQQAIALGRKPHIVVATPGRLVDHLENTKGFSLKTIRYLVLDEADRMLSMDFEKELDKIVSMAPRERHTYLFSATMTKKVEKLQRASLKDPVKVEVSSKYQTVDTLKQYYLFVPAKFKDCYMAFLMNEFSGNSTIIFAGTCKSCMKVTYVLRSLGFPAIPLHGQMSQSKRLGSLAKFKSGHRSILVATDVASRGLDIPEVDIVLNYDIPANPKDYVHRVGRTARAGRSGRALNLVTQYDVELYQRIEHFIGTQMPIFPTEENEVMILLERVSEAQRIASMELKEAEHSKSRKGGRKQSLLGDDDDAEEGSIARGLGTRGLSGKSKKRR